MNINFDFIEKMLSATQENETLCLVRGRLNGDSNFLIKVSGLSLPRNQRGEDKKWRPTPLQFDRLDDEGFSLSGDRVFIEEGLFEQAVVEGYVEILTPDPERTARILSRWQSDQYKRDPLNRRRWTASRFYGGKVLRSKDEAIAFFGSLNDYALTDIFVFYSLNPVMKEVVRDANFYLTIADDFMSFIKWEDINYSRNFNSRIYPKDLVLRYLASSQLDDLLSQITTPAYV